MSGPVVLPSSCLIAVATSGPGAWKCVDGHLHIDVRTALEARGIEPTQENMDALTEKLKDVLPHVMPGFTVSKARIEE